MVLGGRNSPLGAGPLLETNPLFHTLPPVLEREEKGKGLKRPVINACGILLLEHYFSLRNVYRSLDIFNFIFIVNIICIMCIILTVSIS